MPKNKMLWLFWNKVDASNTKEVDETVFAKVG